MLSINMITSFVDIISGMLLLAFVLWGLFEIAKAFYGDKIPKWFKKGYVWIIMGVAFVVYTIIAQCKGFINPIVTGLFNAFVLGCLEGSIWAILTGVEKLAKYIWSKIYNKNKEKNNG